jgi:hypothetical protein
VIIPYDLEQHIKEIVDEIQQDLQMDIPEFLIPIHKEGTGRGLILSYTETTDPKIGNLKYWVMPNELMFSGIDPRLDGIFHVLNIFFEIFNKYSDGIEGREVETRIDTEFFQNSLGEKLRERCPPDLEDCFPTSSEDHGLVMDTGASQPLYPHCAITAKEALKFGFWVSGGPDVPVHYDRPGGLPQYCFPDERFWKAGDEGKWDGKGFPRWTEWAEKPKFRWIGVEDQFTLPADRDCAQPWG